MYMVLLTLLLGCAHNPTPPKTAYWWEHEIVEAPFVVQVDHNGVTIVEGAP